MARQSLADLVLDLAERDPRAASAGPAALFLLAQMARLAARQGQPDALRYGPGLEDADALARWFRVSVSDWVSAIGSLTESGLVAASDSGFALLLPGQAATPSDRRAEQARINGMLGGRKRKADAPGPQRALLLPIEGGAGAAAGSVSGSVSYAHSTSTSSVGSGDAGAQVQAHGAKALAAQLAAMCGTAWQPDRKKSPLRTVGNWLRDAMAAGLSASQAQAAIVRAVAQVLARDHAPACVTSLGYFDAPVREAIAAADDAPAAPAQQRTAAEQAFIAACARARESGAAPPRWAEFQERAAG